MAVLVTEAAGHQNQHDRTLEALAEAKNWKQALAHVEKRLKKTKNDRLLIDKALVLLRVGDGRSSQQAYTLLETTLQSMSPVTENDVLHAIEDAATALDSKELHSISSAAWEKTLKARPNDEGLLAELFERKVFALDWDAARKLAMTRMKARRDWYFRYLICLHLSATSKKSTLPDNMKAMNAGLAIKSLQKSANDVVPDPEFVQDPAGNSGNPGQVKLKNASPSSKSIETQRELDLLVEIFLQQKKYPELLSILEDDTRTGVRSRLGNTFGTLKDVISVLVSCKEWKKLWELCDDLLRPLNESAPKYKYTFGKLADDWGVWQAYLQAGLELFKEEPQRIKKSLELMSSLNESGKSQNASLIAVDHGLLHADIHAENGQDVLADCLKYYSKHSQKPFVLKQLRSCYQLSAPQRASLLSHARTISQKAMPDSTSKSKNARRAWLYTEINTLKLDYYLVISPRASQGSCKPLLHAFIRTGLNLYEVASTIGLDCDQDEVDYETVGAADRRIGDDAAILAATALIQLYLQGESVSILRAALVLETLLQHSKHNYDGILLAVRVYVYLGQIGRAVELFHGLDTKNIQNLSTFWIIGCRLSTLHPHPSRRMRCDPGDLLNDAASWIGRSSKSIRNALGECLEEKSYRNLLRTIKTFESSKTSIPNIMVQAEKSAVQWFNALQPPMESVTGAFDTSAYTDNRELRAFPNYGQPSHIPLEERLRPGPLPKANWCRLQQRFSGLRLLYLGHPLQADDASDMSKLFSESSEDDSSDMTVLERTNDQLYQTCFDLSLALCSAKGQSQGSAQATSCIQAIEDLKTLCDSIVDENDLQKVLPNPDVTPGGWYLSLSWSALHNIYQRVYIMRFLIGTLRFFAIIEQDWKVSLGSTKNHFSKEAQRLEPTFRKALRTIKDWAKRWQIVLREAESAKAITDTLIDDSDTSADLQRFLAEEKAGNAPSPNISSFVRGLISGWVDTLDGLADLDDGRL